MGIFSRLIDAIAPEVIVEVRDVRKPREDSPAGKRGSAHVQRLSDSQLHELIGACRGVLSDGKVVEPEAKFLLDWLQSHQENADQWPHNFLYERIVRILADGRITDEEEKELLDTISKVTEAPALARMSDHAHGIGPDADDRRVDDAGAIPFSDPAPRVEFKGRTFCAAGQFVYGPRSEVESLITARGGKVVSDPSAKPDYVLVGSVGTRKTMNAADARKLEEALQLRGEGTPIAIIAEKHWVTFV